MCEITEGLEIENKFITDSKTFENLLAFFSHDEVSMLAEIVERDERTNTYHDTADFDLYKRGMELRVREKKSTKIKVDLKTPENLDKPKIGPNKNGIMLRGEFSMTAECDVSKVSLKDFNKTSAGPYIKHLKDKPTVPLCLAKDFKRWKVTYAPSDNLDSKVEMAIERGRFANLDGTRSSEEVYIIEFESKDGNVEALLAAIEKFKSIHGDSVTLSTRTKGEMAIEWLAQDGGLTPDLHKSFEKAHRKRSQYYTKARLADEQDKAEQLKLEF